MDVNGSNLTHLTNSGNQYRFSPDGSKIVYELDLHIYIMNVDGSSQNQLTGGYLDLYPQFSPDGSKIVFVSKTNNLFFDIYTMDVDGSNQINLTNNNSNVDFPQFSPDGSKIVFVSDGDGNQEIYIMDSDGSNQINLTNNSGDDREPQFQPQP